MLDTFLPLLIAALLAQIALTWRFLSRLQATDPALCEKLGRPNALFFLLHGGPGDRHPFLEFLRHRRADSPVLEEPEWRVRAGRLLLLYRIASGLWIASIASAVWLIVEELSV